MHEMALAEGVRSIVEDGARSAGATQVRRVVLEIGALAAVEVEALRFCLEVVLRDTCAESAEIICEDLPGQAWCLPCETNVLIASRLDPCPQCGSYQLQVTGGEEMRVKELLVD